MKIAMIGQKGIPATFGGIEHHVEMLSRELAGLGHEVTVFARRWYSPPRSAAPDGVRRVYVPTIRTKHLDAAVHSFLCALRTAAGRTDIVHFHAIGPGLFSPIPRLFGKKVVTTIHRLDWAAEKWKTPAKRILKAGEWISTVAPHARIVVSRDLQDYLAARHGARSVHIPQGTMIPSPLPPRLIREKLGLAGGDYVLFMGRLSPEKRVEWLIRAFRSFAAGSEAAKGVRLVIAGGASATDRYAAGLHREAGGSKDIIFTGNVTGEMKDELLTNALLFVLPSSVEGLPIVLMETRNYGLACLASDIPPHREIIRDGDDGILFRADAFEDLTARLSALMADRPRLARIGAQARKRMEGHASWRDVAERTLEVYRGALAPRGR